MSRESEIGRRIPLIERKIIRPFKFIVCGTVIGFILLGFIMPSYLSAPIRAKVAKAQAELRYISTALEQYFMDTGAYPPGNSVVGDLAKRVELTTPVAYITEIPKSPVTTEYFLRVNSHRIFISTLLPLIVITFSIWIIIFRKMPETALVNWWEAIVLWLLGSLITSTPHDTSADIITSAIFVPGCFSSLLWIGHYFGRRKMTSYTPPGRAFLLCAILPLLFTLKITHNSWVQQYAESSIANSKQTISYLYATDAQSYWILLSTGPDNVYDFNSASCPIHSDVTEMIAWIKKTDSTGKPNLLVYDPTNGTLSTGDIYRMSIPGY